MEDDVQPDPSRVLQHATPRQVGIVSISPSSRSALRGRWYYQDEWSAATRRRVMPVLEQFETTLEFVQFAIEAARIRRLPPPNAQKKTSDEDRWSELRIERALKDLLRGKTARSLTLQFFNAAVDEMEGMVWTSKQLESAITEEQAEEIDGEPAEAATIEPLEFDTEDLRARYVLMLIAKAEEFDGIPPDDLLDRIERIVL